jgi:Lar family restriction alleviation protein
MSEKKYELLPCPFCGGQPLLTTHGNEYTKNRGTEIKCSDCIVIRKTYAIKHSLGWTIDTAIEAWNRRVAP